MSESEDPGTEILSSIRNDLMSEHVRRHGEFFRLSLAMSFASLFFLLQLEQLHGEDDRHMPCILLLAWASTLASGIAGVIYLIQVMIHPLRILNNVRIEPATLPDGRKVVGKILFEDRNVAPSSLIYWIHLASLLLMAVFAAVFHLANQ
jgi:hypothetical protein